MSPKVSFAKTTLPFPIFAADFDPFNRGYLVVGGGGGEGRSGVPNQIVSNDSSTFRIRISKALYRRSLMSKIDLPFPRLPKSTFRETKTLCNHLPASRRRMV